MVFFFNIVALKTPLQNQHFQSSRGKTKEDQIKTVMQPKTTSNKNNTRASACLVIEICNELGPNGAKLEVGNSQNHALNVLGQPMPLALLDLNSLVLFVLAMFTISFKLSFIFFFLLSTISYIIWFRFRLNLHIFIKGSGVDLSSGYHLKDN